MEKTPTAPALLSRWHLASLGITFDAHGQIFANKHNWEKFRTLPVKQVAGTMFEEIVDATPENLAKAVAAAEAIFALDLDDKLIVAQPRSPTRDWTSFDVTDFSDSVTFYL